MGERVGNTHVNLGLRTSDFDTGLKRAKSGLRDYQREVASIGRSIKNYAAMFASIGGAYLTVSKILDSAQLAAKYEQSRQAFRSMAEGMGADAEREFKRIRQLSAGLIDDNALVESMNKALALGIPIEKLGDLMLIARAKSRDMAITTTEAFEKLAIGIGRVSALRLDDLGIMVKVGEANEKMAASLKKTVSQLTSQEQRQALLNATLEAGQEALTRHNLDVLTAKERTDSWSAATKNLEIELGKLVRGPISDLRGSLAKVVSGITDAIAAHNRLAEGDRGEILARDIETLEKKIAIHKPKALLFPWWSERIKEVERELEGLKWELENLEELSRATSILEARRAAMAVKDAGEAGGLDTDVSAWQARQEAQIAIVRMQQESDRAVRESMKGWEKLGELTDTDVPAWRARAASEAAVAQIIADSDKAARAVKESMRSMIELSERTANAMEQNFSDFFFNIMEGRFDSLKDVARAAFSSINRMAADILGQKFTDILFGSSVTGGVRSGGILSKLFSWGGGGVHVGAGGTTAVGMASGGTITEPVWGIGMSGRRYLFGEGGEPEEVIPHSRLKPLGGSGVTDVHHHYEVTIVAADARSFTEMIRRNPQAVIGPLREALRAGDQGLVGDMRGVM